MNNNSHNTPLLQGKRSETGKKRMDIGFLLNAIEEEEREEAMGTVLPSFSFLPATFSFSLTEPKRKEENEQRKERETGKEREREILPSFSIPMYTSAIASAATSFQFEFASTPSNNNNNNNTLNTHNIHYIECMIPTPTTHNNSNTTTTTTNTTMTTTTKHSKKEIWIPHDLSSLMAPKSKKNGMKKKRRRLNLQERRLLEAAFAADPSPPREIRTRLSRLVNLECWQIDNWFQNKRARSRRKPNDLEEESKNGSRITSPLSCLSH